MLAEISRNLPDAAPPPGLGFVLATSAVGAMGTPVAGDVPPSSSAALRSPAPHVLVASAGSQLPRGNGVEYVLSAIRFITSTGVMDGNFERINATTPATCGAAIDVPAYWAYEGETGAE